MCRRVVVCVYGCEGLRGGGMGERGSEKDGEERGVT